MILLDIANCNYAGVDTLEVIRYHEPAYDRCKGSGSDPEKVLLEAPCLSRRAWTGFYLRLDTLDSKTNCV